MVGNLAAIYSRYDMGLLQSDMATMFSLAAFFALGFITALVFKAFLKIIDES